MREGGFDAAFLAVGAHIGKRAYIPAGEAARILDAVSLLREHGGGGAAAAGRRVVVYGGGDTAMDAARTAKRLGATDAIIVYRRTRERMPAHDFEVEEAEEEGVMMKWLSTIKHADEGKLVLEQHGARRERASPSRPASWRSWRRTRWSSPSARTSTYRCSRTCQGIEVEDGVVQVGPNMMTGHRGIFAGGDMVPAERTVTVAIGHGKKAARNIDGWLRGREYAPPPKHELATFEMLNTWYYADAPRTVQPQLEVEPPALHASRRSSAASTSDNALFEARRCLSCGNCFSCDNCYGVCPDNAVIKLGEPGELYEIDLDFCKGCGMCVAECPCGAIEMVPEEI